MEPPDADRDPQALHRRRERSTAGIRSRCVKTAWTQGVGLYAPLTIRFPLQDPVEVLEALRIHTQSHAPPHTNLTFRKLPFHAQPYLMPRDTVANRAATKVLFVSHDPHAEIPSAQILNKSRHRLPRN